MTDDTGPRAHPQYGRCEGCQQLKHVTADGLLREHNRFQAAGTVVTPTRCSGSGLPYLAPAEPDEVSA